jgi:hypothetical protein
MTKFKLAQHLTYVVLASLIIGCGQTDTEPNKTNETDDVKEGNMFLDVGGSMFSIPSPIQTAMFIKESGAEFNSEALNSPGNINNYSSGFYKALNLGIYGTDLGYATIYENNDLSLKYMNAVRQIANDIGLISAFSENLLESFSSNMGNKDSLLVFVSEAYKSANSFLKENDRHDDAALVLAGGWIEALYISCMAQQEKNNPLIVNRIAEQHNSLSTLIEMLGAMGNDEDYTDLTIELEELYSLFEDIEYSYKYVPSVTVPATKTTTLKSESSIDVSNGQMEEIINKLIAIRNELIQ